MDEIPRSTKVCFALEELRKVEGIKMANQLDDESFYN